MTFNQSPVVYFTTRLLALFLLIKFNEQTLNWAADQIGWFSTIILGFACLYLVWFAVASIPGVFYYWATDNRPKYIPPSWEKNPPPEL